MPLRLFLGAMAGAAVLGLSGCAGQPLPVPETRVPVPAKAPAPVRDAAIALEARRAAMTFVQVVERVEPVAEAECRARAPRLDCDFLILVDDRPGVPANAFQTINDRGQPIVAFTLGLIADARNADELAFVLSHEAAHHIAGHLDRQRENATAGAVVFGQLAGALGARTADEVARAQELGAVVGARSYSREFELEADRLGAIITARAGYDPLRGAEFFFRIPDPGDAFLSTHPPNAQRLEAVRETVAALRAGS